MRCYIALLTEDAANRYRIALPDFPGCEAWSGSLADVRGIAERLLEAAERGLWEHPRPETVQRLQAVLLETEGDLEDRS